MFSAFRSIYIRKVLNFAKLLYFLFLNVSLAQKLIRGDFFNKYILQSTKVLSICFLSILTIFSQRGLKIKYSREGYVYEVWNRFSRRCLIIWSDKHFERFILKVADKEWQSDLSNKQKSRRFCSFPFSICLLGISDCIPIDINLRSLFILKEFILRFYFALDLFSKFPSAKYVLFLFLNS